MSAEASDSASNAQGVFVYMGQGSVVPRDVTRVYVHPSVRMIADGAFSGCDKLVEVELCEGLEEIGWEAFRDCTSLRRITIPSSVRIIADGAFCGCCKLVEVEMSEGLEEIGSGAFYHCKSLRRITIPSSVRVIAGGAYHTRIIGGGAFQFCHELVEVELCEGLEEIGEYAFQHCRSLRRIAIPSTVRVIAKETFSGCSKLVEVELCEGLEEIGYHAFAGCPSLKGIAVPSSLRVIAEGAFHWCQELVVVELCEGLQEIGEEAFYNCVSLRNIAIPLPCQVGEGVFDDVSALPGMGVFDFASALEKAFPSRDSSAISEALKHRFDELPIHQMCYYQQYHPPNNMLRHLKEAMGTPEQPDITGTQQDCLGMTPLHILACSTKHDIPLYRSLIEKYPNNLITEDKWGDLPILYAFWGNAPQEVVHLLVEGHKAYFPDHALDWGSMVVTLGEANEPDGIHNLFDTQQNHFSDQNTNWEECAVELARSDSASLTPDSASTETFQLLLRLSVANRLDALGVEKWQNKVENFIIECSDYDNAKEKQARWLYSNLASCEQLKEATSLLELAVWKAKIAESASNIHGQGSDVRNQCRISCGVQQILPLVVSFLSPEWKVIYKQKDETDAF